MKLPTQVFVSHTTPEPHLVEPVVNELFWKPRKGGMWTSTLDEEGGDWVRWLKGEELSLGEDYSLDSPKWGGKLWVLEPAECNVAVISDPVDLKELHSRYPMPVPNRLSAMRSFDLLIDWEAASREYDAVHIPRPWAHRFGFDMSSDSGGLAYDASMFFYVMDAECTLWFRWCFEGEPQLLDSVTTERR